MSITKTRFGRITVLPKSKGAKETYVALQAEQRDGDGETILTTIGRGSQASISLNRAGVIDHHLSIIARKYEDGMEKIILQNHNWKEDSKQTPSVVVLNNCNILQYESQLFHGDTLHFYGRGFKFAIFEQPQVVTIQDKNSTPSISVSALMSQLHMEKEGTNALKKELEKKEHVISILKENMQKLITSSPPPLNRKRKLSSSPEHLTKKPALSGASVRSLHVVFNRERWESLDIPTKMRHLEKISLLFGHGTLEKEMNQRLKTSTNSLRCDTKYYGRIRTSQEVKLELESDAVKTEDGSKELMFFFETKEEMEGMEKKELEDKLDFEESCDFEIEEDKEKLVRHLRRFLPPFRLKELLPTLEVTETRDWRDIVAPFLKQEEITKVFGGRQKK